ncbi:MAG: chromosomal replication initiator protein DnaA [Pseudomonadota bacterium]|nr:chromosomal replication initiator protein DnaA [Pseudomonadota bacterium]QKK04747.1 MAG: chromosomal replication initiator protein DnaA [Pseudomonadota bacterium]
MLHSKHSLAHDTTASSANGQGSDFSIDHKWEHISKLLKKQIGDTEFRNWIGPLSVCAVQNRVVEIAAPTRFVRDWVAMHYADKIKRIWEAAYPGDVIGIDIIVAPEFSTPMEAANAATANDGEQTGGKTSLAQSYAKDDGQTEESSEVNNTHSPRIHCALDPRFTFGNFVAGESNELALAAAKRVAESSTVSFNPLFLYGGVGLGKTHLMHAIGWAVQEQNPTRKVMYMSAEKFMYEFILSLRHKDTVSFKEMFRSVDILMIDDVQFISGKTSTQEEFFHTFNALIDQNKQIVISADRPPSDIDGFGERLRSRLGGGLVADIHPADEALRLKILKSKLNQMPAVSVPEAVLVFLAEKITSNIRELEGALNRIVMHTELTGREMSLAAAQTVLQDLLRAYDRKITVEDIKAGVAKHYGTRPADMDSPRRARAVARPRQVAMYLSKILTPASLPDIGRQFGGRDHTTVLYATRKIEELMTIDPALAEDVEKLKASLQHL